MAHKRAAISSPDSPLSRARFELHPASTASYMTTTPPVPILPASPIILRPLQSVRCVDPMCRSSPPCPRNAETTFRLHSCLIISPSRFSAESRVLFAREVILSMPACMRLARRPDMHLGKPLTHASARSQCPILGLPPATLSESRFATWTAPFMQKTERADWFRRRRMPKPHQPNKAIRGCDFSPPSSGLPQGFYGAAIAQAKPAPYCFSREWFSSDCGLLGYLFPSRDPGTRCAVYSFSCERLIKQSPFTMCLVAQLCDC